MLENKFNDILGENNVPGWGEIWSSEKLRVMKKRDLLPFIIIVIIIIMTKQKTSTYFYRILST